MSAAAPRAVPPAGASAPTLSAVPATATPATAADLDPEDWEAFRRQAHAMLDDVLDHVSTIRNRPVWRPLPDASRAEIRAEALPEGPSALAEVHQDFLRLVQPYGVGNVHPRFMGWVHGGGTAVGVVAEMLAAGLNANLGGRDHAPIEIERQVVRWVARLMGFPDTASGLFVTGASMANLIGVLVARTGALGRGARAEGMARSDARLVAYASGAAHNCVERAMDMAGLGSDALRRIPIDEAGRMDVPAAAAAVSADRRAGLTPFLLVGTAGTVDIGAIDDLTALADLAAREGLHFHVDGACGALGVMSPQLAPRFAGLDPRADSIALDFHKWGQAPYDAGFILMRDADKHRAAFEAPAAYLRREARGLAAGSPWPCDFGPDLSRGFRALKVWFALRVYGTEQLGRVMLKTCELAQRLAARIDREPELERLAPVALNIVCFRFRGADSDRLNADIVTELQLSGLAAPSTTQVGGRLAIRAALFNHRVRAEDVDTLVEAVLAIGRRLAAA